MAEDKDKDKDKDKKIVLQTRMHCNSCRYKVYKAIVGYPGVEDINIDIQGQKVTLKVGKDVDPHKLFAVVYKKSGAKITSLLSFPPPTKKGPDKEKEPHDVTVVLKVPMHCGACTKKVKKIAWCVGDVYSVRVDGDKITIKGKSLDPKKVCEEMAHRYGKHVELVIPKKLESDNKSIQQTKDKPTILRGRYAFPPEYFSDENPNSCAIM